MGRTGFAAIVAAVIAALTVNVGVAAAGGGLLVGPDNHVDPPLSQSAALTLHSAAGDIQAVVYDGNEGATVSTTLSGFTVPAGAIAAKTTYVVADGQCGSDAPNGCEGVQTAGGRDTLEFTGGGGTLTDGPDAFKGSDGCPWGTDTCLWDTRTFEVTQNVAAGDTSVTASVIAGGDCLNHETQVFAVGPAAAWNTAGYVAGGVGLRNQASGTVAVSGIPAGSKVTKALLYWNALNASDSGGAMQLDGQQVASQLVGAGPDPCWGAGASWAYRADVTSLVTGDGGHTLSGFPTGTTGGADPWNSDSAQPMMEGASLIVFYEKTSFKVSFSTFIPADHVPGFPAFCRVGFRPMFYVFAGDDRSFDPNATSFRTRQLVGVVPESSADADGLEDGSIAELVGPSKAYAPDALAGDNKITPADDDAVLHDCHLLDNVASASTSNMHVDVTRVNAHQVSVHLHGGAANPLVPAAPAIDWDLTVTIDTSGAKPHWTIKGSHDGFPAYEVYVNGQTIYTYTPGPGPYSFGDLLKLFPPLDVSVDRSGDLP